MTRNEQSYRANYDGIFRKRMTPRRRQKEFVRQFFGLPFRMVIHNGRTGGSFAHLKPINVIQYPMF